MPFCLVRTGTFPSPRATTTWVSIFLGKGSLQFFLPFLPTNYIRRYRANHAHANQLSSSESDRTQSSTEESKKIGTVYHHFVLVRVYD